MELKLTEKLYTIPFKEMLLSSSFVKTFDKLPEQSLYQLMLLFASNLKISVLFIYK